MSNECVHSNVYYGVVNIRHRNRMVGAVDVWRCVKCRRIFAEEKRLGILDISPEIGMPSIEDGESWFLLTCKLRSDWALVKVRRDGSATIEHECIDGNVRLRARDFRIDDDHRLFAIDGLINKEIELE
ncbi:MAG: hypothetical protein RMJ59_03130 [Candidatus Nitrosocaldus sp.]|nr:hypothetical protein [Candidatus Nitrosocaldus sp.]MCS7141502.1 hypothetical protein [Candidatus Nitrosocaldus sp.]MDW7999708.1 hypothetical protein [Candidatus Nitrosocaldus sp.]MDW8275362.1 hypothetical protein [Candidatus Nitrosocaldus sp.]